jgi:hypothetical protein
MYSQMDFKRNNGNHSIDSLTLALVEYFFGWRYGRVHVFENQKVGSEHGDYKIYSRLQRSRKIELKVSVK